MGSKSLKEIRNPPSIASQTLRYPTYNPHAAPSTQTRTPVNLLCNRNLVECICIGPLITNREIVIHVYFNLPIIRLLISPLAAPYPIYFHSTSVHSTSSVTNVAQSVLGHHRTPTPPLCPPRTSSATSITPEGLIFLARRWSLSGPDDAVGGKRPRAYGFA
jgi:hypothetical protein